MYRPTFKNTFLIIHPCAAELRSCKLLAEPKVTDILLIESLDIWTM